MPLNLPPITAAFQGFNGTPLRVKTVTTASVNFVGTQTVAGRYVKAAAQPANKAKLNPDKINWALKYFTVHAEAPIAIGDYVEIGGEDYKVIELGDWSAYGFWECTVEQTKKPLLVVNA